MYIIYDVIFLVFAILYLPYFLLKGKFHKGVWQRLGFYRAHNFRLPGGQAQRTTHNSVIWLHAVSVGEVAALRPLWKKLRQVFPERRIAVSTVTKTGNELAAGFSREGEAVVYLPLDMSFIVGRFLSMVSPAVLVITETEIWPNLIRGCYKKRIPIVLVNGRISDEAFKRYKIVKVFLKSILEKIDIFCVQTETDRRKFVSIGAPENKVKVTGNTKYDIITPPIPEHRPKPTSEVGLGKNAEGEVVIVAGSTHRGEEEIILGAFRKLSAEFKNLRLVIAPRHVERAPEVKRLAADPLIVVIDRIGLLVDAYRIADIVFVGGSLIKHGGQNIIEPAIFAKPVIFGPHMFNFKEVAAAFLKNEAALMVTEETGLKVALRRLLRDEKERARLGENARRVVMDNQGATEKCLNEIKKILVGAF